ncbi:DUF397 domain-containing protein [Streptomyces sp. AJS327]|uniref:DUF397 domain-containing protein n=1 Tax=Streptomyces sp. AJS327 TaxID=2545265 RepID=UPI0015DD5A93|nr:DUF397 domain-containing protein [Streptomyces sp. AJS327]MBA0053411.1 DUF397 domain-containing protein [Streptomyces sp. AJS327]
MKNGRVLMAPEFGGAVWKKSSHSGDSQGQCVECADVTQTHASIAVRDSKDPEGPALLFTPEAFSGFIAAVNRNGFDVL